MGILKLGEYPKIGTFPELEAGEFRRGAVHLEDR